MENNRTKCHDKRVSALRQKAAKLRDDARRIEIAANALETPKTCFRAAKQIAQRKGTVAVFLGAGASKCFGWPLTRELLPSILHGIIADDLFEDNRIKMNQNRKARQLLKKVLTALCPGIQFSNHFLKTNGQHLPLVTSLLSMLDFSIVSGKSVISGLSAQQTIRARVLMERAIYEVVEHEMEATEPDHWPMRKAGKTAFTFSRWLDGLRNDTSKIGVVTSNYDLALEQAWGFYDAKPTSIEKLGVDLGFPWLWASNNKERMISRPTFPKRRLYKLHGSTNWLRCSLCDRIYIHPGVDIAIYAFQKEVDNNNTCHCNHAPLETAIVSPSFVREGHTNIIHGIWQSALDWLRRSEDWIIVGYSFPDEDLNIRSLFARALASRSEKPYVTAIQAPNGQTQARYEAFFPEESLTYLNGGLDAFLKHAGPLL